MVANLASVDSRSTTGSNVFGIRKEFEVDLVNINIGLLRSTILGSATVVPDQDIWRIKSLKNFLDKKYKLEATHMDTSEINALIDSICSS